MNTLSIDLVKAGHRTSLPLELSQARKTSRQTASCESFFDGYIPSQPANSTNYGWQTVPIAYPGLEYSQTSERQVSTSAQNVASPPTPGFDPDAGSACALVTGMMAAGLVRIRTQSSPSMVIGNGARGNPVTLTVFEQG